MKFATFLMMTLLTTQAHASGFTAVCEADGVHAYRNSLDLSGNSLGAEWTNSENFSAKWTFVFNGSNEILLDGNALSILYYDDLSLVALDHNGGASAVSTWVYAFNLELEDVVGSQVNSYEVGIKSRSVNFDCAFSHHAN